MNKVKLRLRADVVSDGENGVRLAFKNKDYYRQQVQQLRGHKKAFITIESVGGSKRSLNQNAYWHGVCFPILAEMTGFTEDEIKQVCKQRYIKPKYKELNGTMVKIQRGTSDLDKVEAVEFTEKLMGLAQELGGKILSPCEAGYYCERPELCVNDDCPHKK